MSSFVPGTAVSARVLISSKDSMAVKLLKKVKSLKWRGVAERFVEKRQYVIIIRSGDVIALMDN